MIKLMLLEPDFDIYHCLQNLIPIKGGLKNILSHYKNLRSCSVRYRFGLGFHPSPWHHISKEWPLKF